MSEPIDPRQAPDPEAQSSGVDPWPVPEHSADGIQETPFWVNRGESFMFPYGEPGQLRPSWQAAGPLPPVPRPPEAEESEPRLTTAEGPRIQRYRSRSGLWTLVGVVLAAALVVGLLWMGNRPQNVPGSTPSTTRSAEPMPSAARWTPVPGGQGVEVSSDRWGATAYWEILSTIWDSTGVTITTRLTGDIGTLDFGFFCIDNVTARSYSPIPSRSSLFEGSVGPGRVSQGSVRFDKPRNDTTVILADGTGRQITALVITP